MAQSGKLLCYLLLDKSRRYYWRGPGFFPLAGGLELGRVATWETKQQAGAAALALKQTLGVEAVVAPMYLR